jgi:hypothetical protein
MPGTLALGRWFKIDVTAHWSALLTWGLRTALLGVLVLTLRPSAGIAFASDSR